MPSIDEGKDTVVEWACNRFIQGTTCLDVGPSDGKWYNLLGHHFTMDAVEIFQPYIDRYHLRDYYRNVRCADIADVHYDWYDLIIFGDVIEHMTVPQAQAVLTYARHHCSDMIVAVPFLYAQPPCNGNMYEEHIQPDLTPELFAKRYPGFKLLCQPLDNYAYYIKNPHYPYAKE